MTLDQDDLDAIAALIAATPVTLADGAHGGNNATINLSESSGIVFGATAPYPIDLKTLLLKLKSYAAVGFLGVHNWSPTGFNVTFDGTFGVGGYIDLYALSLLDDASYDMGRINATNWTPDAGFSADMDQSVLLLDIKKVTVAGNLTITVNLGNGAAALTPIAIPVLTSGAYGVVDSSGNLTFVTDSGPASGTRDIVTVPSAFDIAAAVLAAAVEGTLTIAQATRIMLAALAGKATGGGTTTIRFRDQADTKARITATVNQTTGNRTAVTVDGD